jgi:hypothetical protein
VKQHGLNTISVGGSDAAISLCSVLLLVGNLVDGLCTLLLLQLNLAREVNPLLAWVYGMSPVSFMVTKLALVQSGLLLLWMHRHVRAAQVGLQVGAIAYAGIVAYHVAFAFGLHA